MDGRKQITKKYWFFLMLNKMCELELEVVTPVSQRGVFVKQCIPGGLIFFEMMSCNR